jgi:RNA polymerase sigma-70 factor, ECF subfamily
MEASDVAVSQVDGVGNVGDARDADARGHAERDAQVRALVSAHHDFIWRLVRRLGVAEASVDDAVQHVFCVAAQRIADIAAGSERSFLFGIALRVASDQRRSAARREQPFERSERIDHARDPRPSPEEQVDTRRKRAVLDAILDELPIELRTVLVLFELEQMTKSEVAALLAVPVGTAVSRLRRAREEFKAAVQRRKAREAFSKGRQP